MLILWRDNSDKYITVSAILLLDFPFIENWGKRRVSIELKCHYSNNYCFLSALVSASTQGGQAKPSDPVIIKIHLISTNIHLEQTKQN